jgi:hypothetical protein
MASVIFPARDKGIGKAGMFSSIQNLGHRNCRAKLEASQVHQVGPTQSHRHRQGKETSSIVRAVPAGKGSCKTVKAIFCRQVVGGEQFQIVKDGQVLQGYVAIT